MKPLILIVEDDPDSRETISIMVDNLGYQPLAFGSGEDALKGVRGKALVLALVDIMMPEMNGYEVMKALKAIPDFAELPVIFVTARDQDSEIIEGYQSGADYYITKPFTSKQLKYGIELFLKEEKEDS